MEQNASLAPQSSFPDETPLDPLAPLFEKLPGWQYSDGLDSLLLISVSLSPGHGVCSCQLSTLHLQVGSSET